MPEILEDTGMVVIGRNEAQRLARALQSAGEQCTRIVYVDSASRDGSPEIAARVGVDVLRLDPARPMCAARARNEGCTRLLEKWPTVAFVQFMDGDCYLQPEWITRAHAYLREHPHCAIVTGRRREEFQAASLFNLLCDIEWNGPVGEVRWIGGDMMVRMAALQQTGGFDETVIAGEEPELCHRLRQHGWQIVRIPDDMTLHDVRLTRCAQWWKREVRGGYGGLDIAWRFGVPDFIRFAIAAQVWTVGCLAGAVLCLMLAVWLHLIFAVGALVIAGLLGLQVARHARHIARGGMPPVRACWCAAWSWLGRWGQIQGHLKYLLDVVRRRRPKIVEYRASAASGTSIG